MDGFNWDSEIPSEKEIEEMAKRSTAVEPEAIANKPEKIMEEVFQFEEEQVLQEETEEYEFLTNARLRLEQGRLYEMFLKHNLFGDVDSDPRAVANVQKELKDFIQERLEILLGLKPDPKLKKIQLDQSLPFNSLEIDILKKVIARISGGATEQIENRHSISIKSDTLKPLSSPSKSSSMKPIQEQKSVSIRRSANQTAPKQEVATKVAVQEKQPARPDKPLSEWTTAEKAERNKQIAIEQAAKKAPPTKNHVPMPSFDQQVMHYGSQTNKYAANGLVSKIIQSLPSKGE